MDSPVTADDNDATATATAAPGTATTAEGVNIVSPEKEEESETTSLEEPSSLMERTPSEKTQQQQQVAAQAMSLNVAYESLESVRKVNLQLEFENEQLDVTQCIPCLKAYTEWQEQEKNTLSAVQAAEEAAIAAITKNKQRGWRLQRLAATTKSRLQQRRTNAEAPNTPKPNMPPCLGCGTSICPKHRSKDFQKQNIIICHECSKLFSMDFLVSALRIEENTDEDEKDSTNEQEQKEEEEEQQTDNNEENVNDNEEDDNDDNINTSTATEDTVATESSSKTVDTDEDDNDEENNNKNTTTIPALTTTATEHFSLQQRYELEEHQRQQQKKMMNYILEVYDRTLLILQYSIPYIDEVAIALEKMKARHNHIGLGSSATGIASGVMGVAAAATILTPVGPPLLIASMLFGGSATAATAGSEAVNYKSEPNKMADKIMALHAIVTNIACLPATLDHMTTEQCMVVHDDVQHGDEPLQNENENETVNNAEQKDSETKEQEPPPELKEEEKQQEEQKEEQEQERDEQTKEGGDNDEKENEPTLEQSNSTPPPSSSSPPPSLSPSSPSLKKQSSRSSSPSTSLRSSPTSAGAVSKSASHESSQDGGDKNLHWKRVTLNAVKPLTAGALSAISIVTEAHEMNNTLKRIQNGNPCEKATMLRQIQKEMKYNFPTTNDMAQLLQQRI